MAAKRVSLKGRGPELFGQGIDLLFGGTELDLPPLPGSQTNSVQPPPSSGANDTMLGDLDQGLPPLETPPPIEGPPALPSGDNIPPIDSFPVPDAMPAPPTPPVQQEPQAPSGTIDVPPPPPAPDLVPTPPSTPFPSQPPTSSGDIDVPPPPPAPEIVPALPPMPRPPLSSEAGSSQLPKPNPKHEEPSMPDDSSSQTHEPEIDQGSPVQSVVGVPGANGTKPGDVELSEDLKKRVLDQLSDKEIREILSRLTRRDREKLDRDVDHLYEDVSVLLSGNRREATTAFELLRRARQIILLQPEQYAEAEFLVQQVRARLNQIRQSIEGGAKYGRTILAYELVWMIGLTILAIVTTVSGGAFVSWIAWLLNVPVADAGLQWAVLFLSTLAWGGIGGVTSALWSMHYHISVQRDYDPVENLWYWSQPVLGMVLGGIVYLIMASGFLIVNVTLVGDAALGARLLPAAVAVVVGFQQTVFLRLIERIIQLIAPDDRQKGQNELPTAPPTDSTAGQEQPPEAPAI